MNKIETKI